MNVSGKARSKWRSLDKSTAPRRGALLRRACATPVRSPFHCLRPLMVQPLSVWYGPTSPTPGPGWYAPPPLAAPPRRFPREKPGLPVLLPPLLHLPRCLPVPPRRGCLRWPPGPSHCLTTSAGGRCRGEPGTWVGGTAVGVGVISPRGSPWPPLTDGRACVGWRGARRQLARAGWHFRSRAPLAVWRQNGPIPPPQFPGDWKLGVSSDLKVEQALGFPWRAPSRSSLGPSSCRQPGRAGSGQPAASGYPSARALRPPLPVPGPLEGVGLAWSPRVFGGILSASHAKHPDGSLQRQMPPPVGALARPAQVCEPCLPWGAPSITSYG